MTRPPLDYVPEPDTISRGEADARALRAFRRGMILGAACFGLIGFVAGSAQGHSWYSGACCSDKDCAPITPDRVTWTREGWLVTLGPGDHPMSGRPLSEIVPFDQVLPSQDSDFHACVRPGVSPSLGTPDRIICLYVPFGDVGT